MDYCIAEARKLTITIAWGFPELPIGAHSPKRAFFLLRGAEVRNFICYVNGDRLIVGMQFSTVFKKKKKEL